MIPPNRRTNIDTASDDTIQRISLNSAPTGGNATYLVQRRSLLELFYVGIYTGAAFSLIFLISESIPIFMEEALPSDWNPAAVRAISLAVWAPLILLFVFILSKIVPLAN